MTADPPRPSLRLASVVLDCPDAHALAAFYAELLGWEIRRTDHDWALIAPPDGGTCLSFQSEEWYEPPVWPERAEAQTKMVHLDIRVEDLDDAEALALAAGATRPDHQPREDVRVMLDPAGHPFCLFLD